MTQDKALDILKTTNDNIFLTGAPGTGKSYLINKYVAWSIYSSGRGSVPRSNV